MKKTPIGKDRRFAGHNLPGGNDAVDRGRFDYTTEGSEYHDNRLRIDSNMSICLKSSFGCRYKFKYCHSFI